MSGVDPSSEGSISDTSGGDADTPTYDIPETVNQQAATDAIQAAMSAIETDGSLLKKEIVQQVMPEHPLGYDYESVRQKLERGKRYRGAWWRKVIMPGLETEGCHYRNGIGWVHG